MHVDPSDPEACLKVRQVVAPRPAKPFIEVERAQVWLSCVEAFLPCAESPGVGLRQAEQIQETVAALRSSADVPVLVGGSAIDGVEHAKLPGAGFGGSDIDAVIAYLLELV